MSNVIEHKGADESFLNAFENENDSKRKCLL